MGAPHGNRNAAGPHKKKIGFKSGGKRYTRYQSPVHRISPHIMSKTARNKRLKWLGDNW
jgi:hypothetical protein